MSIVTPAQTVLPGKTISIPQPLQAGYQSAFLILDNLSSYLLQVTIGTNTYWQAPLVEQAYPLTGSNTQPVVITATALASDTSTSGTVAPTWFAAGEGVEEKSYPIALSGPAEVAAATAAALLTQGIPNVLTLTPLVRNVSLPNGISTQAIDVTPYASIIVSMPGNTGTTNRALTVSFVDAAGNQFVDNYIMSALSDVTGNVISDAIIPVRGISQVVFTWNDNGGNASYPIYAYGSNRPVTGMIGAQQHGGLQVLTTGSTVMAVNGQYLLGYLPISGLTQCDFSVSAGVSGEFFVSAIDQNRNTQAMRVMDTALMHTAGGAQHGYGQIIWPIATAQVLFISRTAATATASVVMTRSEYV